MDVHLFIPISILRKVRRSVLKKLEKGKNKSIRSTVIKILILMLSNLAMITIDNQLVKQWGHQ